jgi:ABC-type transport system involved in multi-copper enzyme maturation permease subunit
MRKIAAVVLNTFREAIRDKVFITIIVFSIIIMGSGRIVKPLALGEEGKVIKDIGLNSITFFSVLIGILVGGRLVYKEIEKKTIYLVISRPIHRWQFIVGKHFGLLLVLFESLLIMTGAFYVILFLLKIQANFYLLLSILMTFFQLWIITAIAILLSTFTTPITSAIFAFALYFIGHLTGDLKALAAMSKSVQVKFVCNALYYLLPNLSNFDIKNQVVHNVIIEPNVIFFAIGYAIVYSAVIIFIASLIFQRKDF